MKKLITLVLFLVILVSGCDPTLTNTTVSESLPCDKPDTTHVISLFEASVPIRMDSLQHVGLPEGFSIRDTTWGVYPNYGFLILSYNNQEVKRYAYLEAGGPGAIRPIVLVGAYNGMNIIMIQNRHAHGLGTFNSYGSVVLKDGICTVLPTTDSLSGAGIFNRYSVMGVRAIDDFLIFTGDYSYFTHYQTFCYFCLNEGKFYNYFRLLTYGTDTWIWQ